VDTCPPVARMVRRPEPHAAAARRQADGLLRELAFVLHAVRIVRGGMRPARPSPA